MCGLDLCRGDVKRDIVLAESHEGEQVMARTRTRKLLLFPEKQITLLYNLEEDPFETVNLYHHPSYQDDVRCLTKAIGDWRGPGPTHETYINHDAPVINQPNVPNNNDNHREEIDNQNSPFHRPMTESVEPVDQVGHDHHQAQRQGRGAQKVF